ncbi:MAG TPA: hypothetical protein VE289_09030 [Gaiellaceae bacterium]|jgi:hypothetical protein|nr:hypothetical protein [Gaiellaceae bacterium]
MTIFLDTDDLDALIGRVLAEGEAAGLVPVCVVCELRLYRRADALYCGPTYKQRARRSGPRPS